MKYLSIIFVFVFVFALFSPSLFAADLPDSDKVTAKLTRWLTTYPDAPTAKVWVYFRDKGIADSDALAAALAARQKELSARALWRRAKVCDGPLVDAQDLAVCTAYKNAVLPLCTRHRADSRALNAISVEAPVAKIDAIAALDCVVRVDLVVAFHRNNPVPVAPPPTARQGTQGSRALNYGDSWTQLDQINVPAVHDLGFNGEGVIVCMLDTGYYKDHESFAGLDVIAEWDFINNDGNTQNEGGDDPGQHYHGTYTWSALGGKKDGTLYGPAYGASFLLAKTEDTTQEVPIEEDWWTAGIEWAEGLGADVASSSLIYTDWYSYSDMDGQTCVTTIAANWATSKGVVVVNAMGNNGQYAGAIGAPADSDGVISCGAVDSSGTLAYFSSSGPTYDGRIKPDVCAMGYYTFCAYASGTSDYTYASGTSLSTPLVGGAVALLLDAHPDWTPADVKEVLHLSATQSSNPDNYYGWGIPDLLTALYTTGFSLLDSDAFSFSGSAGGQINFSLNGGATNANRDYLLVGSLSGTTPGTLLPGGLTTIPLYRDWFTNFILARLNTSVFASFDGTLDGAGNGAAQLNAPSIPTWVGTTMHYAWAVKSPWDLASNPVEIVVDP